jgi:hypothetical protein
MTLLGQQLLAREIAQFLDFIFNWFVSSRSHAVQKLAGRMALLGQQLLAREIVPAILMMALPYPAGDGQTRGHRLVGGHGTAVKPEAQLRKRRRGGLNRVNRWIQLTPKSWMKEASSR